MDAFEERGQWWLPEAPDRKVSGVLASTEDGSYELSLIGAFRTLLDESDRKVADNGVVTISPSPDADTGLYARVHGQVGSKAVTLEKCLRVNRSENLFGGIATERLLVHRVLRGVWLEEGEPEDFQEVTATMDWLTYWTMQNGFTKTVNDGRDGGQQAVGIKVVGLDADHCQGPDGSDVSLGQSFGLTGDGVAALKLTQEFGFTVSYGDDLVSLEQLLSQVGMLQDLVFIATERIPEYRSVRLRHPDIKQSINLFTTWIVKNDKPIKKLTPGEMYFTLPEIGGMEGVGHWMHVAHANRMPLRRVMATRYSKSMYNSDRLLNCAAALEAYDRNHPGRRGRPVKGSHFEARIKRSVLHAGDSFEALVGDVEEWIRVFKDARDEIAHQEQAESDGTRDLFLSRAAYWLFVLCMLRDARMPESVFNRIVAHRAYASISDGLRDYVMT